MASEPITVYWRPGCMYCASLFRQLKRHHVPHQRVNIWDDPDAAAVVRAAAGGNETVPTVAIGPVALVNPGLDQLLAVACQHAPEAVPGDWTAPRPGKIGRWVSSLLGGRASTP